MWSYECRECGRAFGCVSHWPIRCRCGAKFAVPAETKKKFVRKRKLSPEAERARKLNAEFCTGGCKHYSDGCTLLNRAADSPLPVEQRKKCRTFMHIYRGGNCLADPPLF